MSINRAATPTARAVTDGARALRAYLKKIEQTVPAFCEEHHLDRIQVQRCLNGEVHRISLDFALDIEKATKGKVGMRLWSKHTATPADAQGSRHTGTEG